VRWFGASWAVGASWSAVMIDPAVEDNLPPEVLALETP
jgi:hypothetical protein